MHIAKPPASFSDDGKRIDDANALVAELQNIAYSERNARREAAGRGFVLTREGNRIEVREAGRPSIVRASLDMHEVGGILREPDGFVDSGGTAWWWRFDETFCGYVDAGGRTAYLPDEDLEVTAYAFADGESDIVREVDGSTYAVFGVDETQWPTEPPRQSSDDAPPVVFEPETSPEARAIAAIRALHSPDDDIRCRECVDDTDGYGDAFESVDWPCSTIRTLDDALGLIPSFVILTFAQDDDHVVALVNHALVRRVEYDGDGSPHYEVGELSYSDLDTGDFLVGHAFVSGARGITVERGLVIMHGIDADDPTTDFTNALRDYVKENRHA